MKESKYLSAKDTAKAVDPKSIPGTYIDYKDKLKFDAKFDVDAPQITGIDWRSLFPQPEAEKVPKRKGNMANNFAGNEGGLNAIELDENPFNQ